MWLHSLPHTVPGSCSVPPYVPHGGGLPPSQSTGEVVHPQIRSACVHPQPPVLPQFLLPEAVLGCCVVEGRAVPEDSQA